MSHCPNCGAEAGIGARFCTYCGTQLSAAPGASYATAAQGDYSVMLLSPGTCTAAAAAELVSDACGYTDAEAAELVRNAPITVARNLSETQAAYLAQALSEYGMEVSVYDKDGYREVETGCETVYDKRGGFLGTAAAVLGMIGIGNRITRSMMHRMDYPHRFVGPRPPVFRAPRRPAPAPAPAPRPRQRIARPVTPVRPPRPAPGRPVVPARPSQPAGRGPAAPGISRGPGGRGAGGRGPGGPGGPGGRR